MGVLTDFVIAGHGDAQRVGESTVPSEEFDGFDAKGMSQVEMAGLYAVLTGTASDPAFLQSDDSFVYTASENGPWVQLVPHDLVERVANLSEFEVVRIGREWFRTEEEFRYSGWSEERALAFLRELQELAAKAVESDQAMFMWTCFVASQSSVRVRSPPGAR